MIYGEKKLRFSNLVEGEAILDSESNLQRSKQQEAIQFLFEIIIKY